MSPAETGTVITFVVLLLAGAAYTVQSLETKRRQKRSFINQLRSDIRYTEEIRDNFPAALMSPQLDNFLTNYLKTQWQKLLAVDSTPALQNAAQASISTSSTQTPAYEPGTLTRLHSKNEAIKAASMSKELSQWLKNDASRHVKSKVELIELIKYCDFCLQQITVDGLILDALEYEEEKGSKPALPLFKNCLQTLERIDYHHFTDQQLYELHTYIDKIEASLQQIDDNQDTQSI